LEWCRFSHNKHGEKHTISVFTTSSFVYERMKKLTSKDRLVAVLQLSKAFKITCKEPKVSGH